jgi:tetratricopeptide (TPR) repeat protein/NAD-dependent SIR2 family protein deacetylase
LPDVSLPQPQRATVRQLAYKIKGAGANPSTRFSFFLGAGASVQSGIPPAGEMIAEFRQRIIQEQCPPNCTDSQQQQAWLAKQPWYIDASNNGTLYSTLFETYEQKERGRQLYIEQMIEGRKPSFGYVVLANLMARNYVNTVVTTNFDDLVYNACATFTDIRPVVYAYGGMVSDLRITNARPKILKLHGDYLYSKLKNSRVELSEQDPNMSRHVSILLNEYGLIVVGYSGSDKSIMDLLRQFPPNNDLYWCGRSGSPIPESVRSLLIEVGGTYVEIENFDQMMNEIRSVVGFDIPKMLVSLETRRDQMIDQLKAFSHTYADLSVVLREIYEFSVTDAAARQQRTIKDEALLHYVKAFEAWQKADYVLAENEFRASLKLFPQDVNTRIALGGILCQEGKYSEAEKELQDVGSQATGQVLLNVVYQLAYLYMVQGIYDKALVQYRKVIELAPQAAAAYNGAGLSLMHMGQSKKDPEQLKEAAAMFHKAVELDPASYYQAFNLSTVLELMGDPAESQKWWAKTASLWQLRDGIDPYNYATMQVCLGNEGAAVGAMRAAIERGQPGLAHLALESVLIIESGPNPPSGISDLREMLEEAAKAGDATQAQSTAG